MKRMIKGATGPDTEYSVTVGFCGFIGVETELVVDARAGADEDELLYIIQEDYADELLIAEISDVDDYVYDVDVTFDGQVGSMQTYTVWSNDDDEAIEDALEEAKYDIDIIEFYEI